MLTNDQSTMCGQMTLWDTGSAISSPASASGATPCVSLDGLTIAPSGRVPAPAKPTPQPLEAVTSNGTGGRYGGSLSLQDALELSLANRLPSRGAGSAASAMTWRR